jgi:hypothetical protein
VTHDPEYKDRLGPARGIALSLLLSIPIWALIWVAAYQLATR